MSVNIQEINKLVVSKVNYFNISVGDICEVIEEDGIYKKVISVGAGMDQVHYLYNFEFDEFIPETTTQMYDLWVSIVKPIIMVLAASKTSISHNRMFNDILIGIDGDTMPPITAFENNPEISPSSVLRETLKMLAGYNPSDDMMDDLLIGELYDYINRTFVDAFFKLNYTELCVVHNHWGTFRSTILDARQDLIKLEKELNAQL